MKINSTTVLKGKKKISEATINKFSSNINTLIETRLKESRKLKKIVGSLYVYIYLNAELFSFNKADKLNDKLYSESNSNVNDNLETMAFVLTLRSALKNNIVIPEELDSVVVYFSLSSVDIEESKNNNQDSPNSKVNFIAQKPKYKLDDVIMNDSELRAVMRAIVIIKEKVLIYEKWGFSSVDSSTKSILCFHGKSGTGKTMCAHAVADYLGKNIMIGSYAQIESEFVGVGCKNLQTIFKAAQEQDAVLFIDEADTFLSKRLPSSNDSSKHYNSMSNELFQMLEDYNGCIIFASNHIKDFDNAVISRIIEPVEFILPEKDNRKKILKKLIPPDLPLKNFDDMDLDKLADYTVGFSGRDMRKAVLICCANAVLKYKIERKMEDESIFLSYNDLQHGFKEVKDAFEKLKNAVQGKEIEVDKTVAKQFLEKKRKDTRLMQIAALAVSVDGIIKNQEKTLFKELSETIGVSIDLEKREELPVLEEICENVKTKEEKIQTLDIACRMVSIDGEITESEVSFIKELYSLLGFDLRKFDDLASYLNGLARNNLKWESLFAVENQMEYN